MTGEQQMFDQIDKRLSSMERSVEKITDAMTEMVRYQEKLIALVGSTKLINKNIEKIFRFIREGEQNLNAHIISPVHVSQTLKDKAANWNKLHVTLVTVAAIGVLTLAQRFYLSYKGVIDTITTLTTGGP